MELQELSTWIIKITQDLCFSEMLFPSSQSFVHKDETQWLKSEIWGLKASQCLPAALYERCELWGECNDVMGLFL